MAQVITVTLIVLATAAAVGLLVWAEIATERARERERVNLRREIAHLPLDVRVRLMAAQMRDEAERDLH